MGNIVGAVVLGIVALVCFIISCFQFQNKGFLFNNAYLYASKEEREKMNKAPHYRQSGICFVLIGIIFLVNAIEMIIKTGWLFYVVITVAVIAVIYAVISSITISKKKK